MLRKRYVPRSTIRNKENLEPPLFDSFSPYRLHTQTEDLTLLNYKATSELAGWTEDNILKERLNKTQNSSLQIRKKNDIIQQSGSNHKSRNFKHTATEDYNSDYKKSIYFLKKQVEFLEAANPINGSGSNEKFPKNEDYLSQIKGFGMQCYPILSNFRSAGIRNEITTRKLSINHPQNFSFLLTTPTFCRVIAEDKGFFRRRSSSLGNKPRTHKVHSQNNRNIINILQQLQITRPRYIPSSFKKCRPKKRSQNVRVAKHQPFSEKCITIHGTK